MAAAGFSMQAMLPIASSSKAAQPIGALRAPINSSSNARIAFSSSMAGQKLKASQHSRRAERAAALLVSAVKDGAVLDRKLRVAVIGGGPSGACTAETLAKGGIETFLIERKLDNCKVGDKISAHLSFVAGVCFANYRAAYASLSVSHTLFYDEDTSTSNFQRQEQS